MLETACGKIRFAAADAIYDRKSRNPVALETIPVSRRPGQYLLQSIEAAQFEERIAKMSMAIFNAGVLNKNVRAKNNVELEKLIKTVRFMLCPSLS